MLVDKECNAVEGVKNAGYESNGGENKSEYVTVEAGVLQKVENPSFRVDKMETNDQERVAEGMENTGY